MSCNNINEFHILEKTMNLKWVHESEYIGENEQGQGIGKMVKSLKQESHCLMCNYTEWQTIETED